MIKISFTGDILPSERMNRVLDSDYRACFAHAKGLSDCDYLVGNLETPVAGAEMRYTHERYCFNTPTGILDALKDAGFASVQEAEAAGHRDFYVDITHFWGLDAGWLRITDSTRLQDEAIPSGAEEMYLTAEYIYRNYLSDEGSQKMFQSEFVGIPVEAGEKLAITDVGLIAEGGRITLILPEPTTSGSVALALSGMVPLRPGTYDEAYGTAEHYTACGPYRIASADQKEIVLEPNPHWTGEAAEFKIVRIGRRG